ncbi:toprim domain-containing protein [Barrientosiimonas marina]|uniref:Toprim domain-containing protein n=1 Tax=Lentibacillus kimchii TaxID=1542911 RepID=A0ABW2UU02_9BACI
MTDQQEKVIIVEGLSDKKQVKKIIAEDAEVVCTNGTLGVEKFDELLNQYDLDHRDVYILADEDSPGIRLRSQLARELPHARHIHVSSEYREVAATPENMLAIELAGKQIAVNPIFLI